MTLLELKEEFKRYLLDSSDYYTDKEPITDRKLLQIWLDCAEPREKKIRKLEEENEMLAKRICELQSDLSRAKSQIEKMKCCGNCKHYSINDEDEFDCCRSYNCTKFDKWELAE